MSKWAFNCDSSEYEKIDSDGISWTGSEYIYNYNDREYHREEEEVGLRKNSIFNDDEDELFC